MNKIYTIIFAALLLAAPVLAQETPDSPQQAPQLTCEQEMIMNPTLPSYYCDCKDQSKVNRLATLDEPLDITITDTVWYSTRLPLFLKGFTAYLYSECNVDLIVTNTCEAGGMYQGYTVTSNQTRDVEATTLREKLLQNGLDPDDPNSANLKMYFCIAPQVEGVKTRFICANYNEGPESTCDDCLPLLPNMVLVSSHDGDVFELDPTLIPENATATIDWISEGNCTLEIARGTCNYESQVQEFMPANSTYTIDASLLNSARVNQQKLYVYFWDNYGVGRVRLNVTVNNNPSTGCDNLVAPATDARLVLGTNGALYILRDGQRYTLTGQKF